MKKCAWRIAAWGLCAFISIRYFNGPWVVGPVFAVLFLAANRDQLRKKSWPRYFLFLLASALVYALVHRFADNGFALPWSHEKGWHFESDTMDMLVGPMTLAVSFGSLIMPLLQKLLFSVPMQTVRRGWLFLIGSWYLIILVSIGLEALNMQHSINFIAISMTLWQGIYFSIFKILV